jgi:hypothetical protein
MYAVDGYCYSDISVAAGAFQASHLVIPSFRSGNAYSLSALSLGGDSFQAQYTDGQSSAWITVIPASCTVAGPLVNQTGLNLSDASELSWLVVAVLAVAFSAKSLRRGL